MVTMPILRDFFLWCAILNYGVLLVWFLAFTLARGSLYRLHARWFRLSENQFDVIHYSGMAVYKIATLSLSVLPYVALRIAANSRSLFAGALVHELEVSARSLSHWPTSDLAMRLPTGVDAALVSQG